MLNGSFFWASLMTTSSTFAGFLYTLNTRLAVADSASLILLGLALLSAAQVIRMRARDIS